MRLKQRKRHAQYDELGYQRNGSILDILQHIGWEGPGLTGAEAMLRALQLNIRHLDRGEPVPDSDEVEALVVMGGPMGVYEIRSRPFLTREVRLIEDLLTRGSLLMQASLLCFRFDQGSWMESSQTAKGV